MCHAMSSANGDHMRLNYDRYGNMVSEKWYDSKNKPTYDNEGNIVKPIDKALLKEYN